MTQSKVKYGFNTADKEHMTACIVPTYRASRTILSVVTSAIPHVDLVVVVDDACPEGSAALVEKAFSSNPNVITIRHATNAGVGAAFKTGAQAAMRLGYDFIVKIDADAQMDPSVIPEMVAVLKNSPLVALVKGNRFYESAVLQKMPRRRLIGNSALTLLVRTASGYWASIDPTNGFLAIRASYLKKIDTKDLENRYFFETSLLCALGIRRAPITEMDIPAIYASEVSSMSITTVLWTFPLKLIKAFTRRFAWQYIVADMNIGTIFFGVGMILEIVATALGTYWWHDALTKGIPKSPGTVGLVFVPLFIGFQLLLSWILYDVQHGGDVMKTQSKSSQEGRESESWKSIVTIQNDTEKTKLQTKTVKRKNPQKEKTQN